jgi:type I restriction enzyme S subunit
MDGYDGLKIGPFGSQIKLQDLTDSGFKIYGQENVINRDFTLGHRYLSEESFDELKVYEIREGDVLVTMMGTSGRCEISPVGMQTGIMDSHLIRLRTNREIASHYLRYLIDQSSYVRAQIDLLGKGSIMQGLNSSIIKSLEVLLPPLYEQLKITDFLDWKTGQIDGLIAKKKQLIEKLKEKRIALITQAVTKGLDPNAPMRDSGIPWLGDVPEHWEVMKLHHIVRMKSGSNITSTDIEETGVFPVYGGNGVRGYFENYTHKGSFVLIGRQGALCGNINYAHGKFWASEHAVVAMPDRELNVVWLGETLRAMNLNQYSESAAQPGLSVEAIGRLKMPFPSVYEHGEIANFIRIKTTKIDNLMNVAVQTILRLTEYRTALITAATTGKIDVRNVKIGGKE